MPIGQNLLALFNADFSRDALPAFASGKAVSADPDAVAAFSAILAEQTPADLDALMAQLNAAVGAETAAADEAVDLAASGKELPADMASWLNQLAQLLQPQTTDAAAQASAEADGSTTDQQADDTSVLADLSAQWQRWLSQLPADAPAAETAQPAAAGVIPSTGAQSETRAVASASTVVDADDAAGSRGAVGLSELVSQLRAALQDAAQVQQRVQASAPQPVDEAGLARLVDQLETRLGSGNGRSDADTTDLSKTGAVAQLQQQGQSALSARPVTAPLQSLGVPMGQPGWSEAVVNKVMWMSSQNLQSVEIQLDPAELGPLEIKIQTRGQEHQVQFVSQNAGVRDALEGQMFRLREMFTQQGVGQLDVNVSDGSSGQRQQDGGLFAQGDGRGGERGNAATGMLGDASDTAAPASEVSAQALLAHSRLVDYYA